MSPPANGTAGRDFGCEAASRRWAVGVSSPSPLPPLRGARLPACNLAPPSGAVEPASVAGRTQPGGCRGRGHGGESRCSRRGPVLNRVIHRSTDGRDGGGGGALAYLAAAIRCCRPACPQERSLRACVRASHPPHTHAHACVRQPQRTRRSGGSRPLRRRAHPPPPGVSAPAHAARSAPPRSPPPHALPFLFPRLQTLGESPPLPPCRSPSGPGCSRRPQRLFTCGDELPPGGAERGRGALLLDFI